MQLIINLFKTDLYYWPPKLKSAVMWGAVVLALLFYLALAGGIVVGCSKLAPSVLHFLATY